MSEPKEMINHPSHYNLGPKEADGTAKYETIKIIESWELGFDLGNALKYILRAPHKGTEEQDLNKARWYLGRYIFCRDTTAMRRKFSIDHRDVARAWGLQSDLSNAVHAIMDRDIEAAVMLVDTHLITRAARAGT